MNLIKKLCTSCGNAIAASQIARHQASHIYSIKCEHCPMTFNRRDNYKRHLNQHHRVSKCLESTLPEIKLNIKPKEQPTLEKSANKNIDGNVARFY